MATITQMGIRRVVPRWRTFRETLTSGELDPTESLSPSKLVNDEFFEQKERDWKSNREILFATDLVGASVVFGMTDAVKDAALFLLDREHDTTPLVRRLAKGVLGIKHDTIQGYVNREEREQARAEIQKLKSRRTNEPRNAFVWMDLARLYVLLGLPDQARIPLKIAMALAPHDRFIVRSSVRFHLHDGNPDQALDLLRRNERTKSDPWLMAAELAVSHVAGKSPKFFKQAEVLAANNNSSPFHLSELLTSIASIDMWDGKNRKARRLFIDSLKSPNENALAQTIWASRDVGITEIPDNVMQISNASEARTLAARNHGEWELAVQFANGWITDESFSARPYSFAGSVLTSILGRPEAGEAIARSGLATNQNHPGLINNIAFALVEQGKAKDAKIEISKASRQDSNDVARVCLMATEGLIEYRLGKLEKGRTLYLAAIAEAERLDNKPLKAVAQIYFAREEARVGVHSALSVFQQGFKEIQKANSLHNLAIAAIIQKEIDTSLKTASNKHIEPVSP
jgi:tetratricopeptide (TPR) repeat protein